MTSKMKGRDSILVMLRCLLRGSLPCQPGSSQATALPASFARMRLGICRADMARG
jgi:hypothetical protein